MAGRNTPIDPWKAAHAAYMKDLNAEEQALFATATLDNLLASTNTAQKQHQDESKSRYVFNKLQPLVDAIDQFGRALDVYASTYSLAMAPLWGSIRVLLHVRLAFHTILHYLSNVLKARPGLTCPSQVDCEGVRKILRKDHQHACKNWRHSSTMSGLSDLVSQ